MADDKDQDTRQSMQKIGETVKAQIPEGYGFFVFVFPFNNDKGRANYCSNGKREDVINTLKAFLIQAGHNDDWMKHI